ncbi:PA2928 family protein [Microbacterium sp. AGC85]
MTRSIETRPAWWRREPWRISTILVSLLVLGTLGVLFVVPTPLFIHTDARADAGIVIAERDGHEIAVTVYNDHGANLLAGIFGDQSGGVRITAIDIETGDTVWDERIHEVNGSDGFLTDRRLVAANDRYVFLSTTFTMYIFSIDDGTLVATDEDIPELDDATGPLSRMLYRDGTDEILFMGSDDGALRVLDLQSLEVHDADSETSSTWRCVLNWTGHSYDDDVTTDAWSAVWHVDGEIGGEGLPADATLLGRMVREEPLPNACADAVWEEEVFPEPETVDEMFVALGADGPHRLALMDGEADLGVVDASSGEVLGRLSPVGAGSPNGRIMSAAGSVSGAFALVSDRDLTGIAPAVGTDAASSVVHVMNADGEIHETILGRHGWFGLPW